MRRHVASRTGYPAGVREGGGAGAEHVRGINKVNIYQVYVYKVYIYKVYIYIYVYKEHARGI
jgi:hypothetical protein